MMAERRAARQLSKHIEAMLHHADEPEANGLLNTARQLARLGDLFGPPPPAFERRLTARVEARLAERPRRPAAWLPRLAWAVAAALLLLAVILFTSPGQSVVARLMAVLRLGQTEVRVAPATTPVGPTLVADAEVTLSGLAEAQAAVSPCTLWLPTDLPPGYRLHRISSRHFDQLPDWVQPLFVDVVYRHETPGVIWELAYRQYFVASGGLGTLEALAYAPEDFESLRQVTVGGRPAVLLAKPSAAPVQPDERILHLVWEGEGAVFTLTATELLPDELVRVAESVSPYR